jgi:hypothetical protein
LGFPRERWTLLWDLTISGWPNEWINITWQCFIKSDSRYLYEYIIKYTNYRPCWSMTRRFVFPRKVRSPDCDLTFLWETNRRVTLQQGW